jgi:hypothetical protein
VPQMRQRKEKQGLRKFNTAIRGGGQWACLFPLYQRDQWGPPCLFITKTVFTEATFGLCNPVHNFL